MILARFPGLAQRMLLLAVAVLLPVLMLMAYMGWRNTEEQVDRERTRTAHLAELLAREQGLPFSLGRQKLHDLALMHTVTEMPAAEACRTLLKQAVAEASYLAAIGLYSASGELLNASADQAPSQVAASVWFGQAVAEGKMVVSDHLVDSATGRGSMVMALPLADRRGAVRMVLALWLDLAKMSHALGRVPVAEGTNIVVLDSRGTVLAPERWTGMSVAGHPVFQRIAGITAPTSFEARGIDGVERIFVARPLEPALGGSSYLWVAAPKSSATEAALNGLLGGTLLVFITVITLFAAIWREGSRIVLRPVRQLREAARLLAGSQFSARTNLPHTVDEIGQLAATFDEMADKIEARDTELERSRESLLRVNRTLRLLSAVKDVVASASCERILLDELCGTVVGMSDCALVHIVRVNYGPMLPLTVVSLSCRDESWRDRIQPFWVNGLHAQSAAGTAVRDNHPCVIHDLRQAGQSVPKSGLAAELGIEAVAALPVRVEGKIWGALVLSSGHADTFDEEETRLLAEVADELGRGVEMQRLRAEKQAAEASMLDLMEGLEQRVNERTAELEQANRDLEAFGYSLSHDLRAPLRAIDGFAQLLDEECGAMLNADCQVHLARIRAAAQRMSRLIDSMIGLARISNANMATTDVDLTALVAEIGGELAEAESTRTVRLAVAPDLSVRGDPGLLRALVQNLLENAWKYTGRVPQGEVEFGAKSLASGERVYFVRDNGAGFDMNHADHLFRPFGRLHRTEEYPGTGIGLATAARIVSRHGGRIWAEAEKGRGATFYFTLA